MNDKSVYTIEIIGCDDTTEFDLEMNDEQAEFMQNIVVLSKETSTYSCMPIITITKK